MKIVLAILLLATVVFATTVVTEKRVYKEYTRAFPPPVTTGWQILSAAPSPNERIRMTLLMRHRNRDELNRIFWEVSNPRHSNYGKYLSLDELHELVAPTEQTVSQVIAWLASAGIQVEQRAPSMMLIRPTVRQAERLLQVRFTAFNHLESGVRMVRSTDPYTVPLSMMDAVDAIIGVNLLPAIRRQGNAFTGGAMTTDPLIGPQQLRQRYNVTDVANNPNATQAVAEFQAQFYSPKDLQTFWKQYVQTFANTTADTIVKVIGTNEPTDPGVEAELDVQYIMGVNYNAPTYFYSDASFDFWGGLAWWQGQLDSNPDAPLIHSVSYGDQTSSQPSSSVVEHLDEEFQKLGVRGLSIIFASGDSGSGCDFCIWMQPSYPATSVYVTSVGATHFLNGAVGPEGAVTAFSSGGGFSWDNSEPMPDYQKAVVQNYLTKYSGDLPFGFMFNKNGRATPDVSALGIGFAVIVNGAVENIGGTSASSPTFAAIMSLLNNQQLNAGKPSLGFLNPWLYQTQGNVTNAFFDVTVGGDQDGCCLFPFKCAPGWDAVTGLGTPNYVVLKTALP